jgi:hypothetical protein
LFEERLNNLANIAILLTLKAWANQALGSETGKKD